MKRLSPPLLLTFLLFCLAGCGPRAVSVDDPWARPGNVGENSAIYFVIHNPTTQDDILLSASSDVAAQAELHMTMMQENDVMTMMHQDEVPIPAESEVKFEPGGLHVMLVNLQRDLRPGDQFEVNLGFQNAGQMALEVEVQEP